MDSVKRIFVEKKALFAVKAKELKSESSKIKAEIISAFIYVGKVWSIN